MKNLSIAGLFLFLLCLGVSAVEKIDINTAPLDDLVKIIHIGEQRALELISLRPFSSLDDLIRIKGIGPVRVEDIKKQGLAYIEMSPEKTAELPEVVKSTTETEPLSALEKDTSLKIDINTASMQELQMLVGIGVVLAQRIVDLRPFYTLDELIKVNGIGTETLESIKSQGLAWISPNLAPPKAEKVEIFDKGSAETSVPLQQIGNKKAPAFFSVFLPAFALSLFSGIIILTLKRKLASPLD